MRKRILLIEDEARFAQGLRLNFELEGHEVIWAATGMEARHLLDADLPDLVVLDVMLPDVSGFQLLQELKRRDVRLPVLVLTACAGDEDRIMGLSLGADDYLTKPFNLEELVLRVRGMLRRGDWYHEAQPESIDLGGGVLHPSRSVLERGGERTILTERELALLLHLWRRRNQVVSREELLVEVWGYAPEVQTRTVDIFIGRLRRLLGDDPEEPRKLRTLRGQGYILVQEGPPPAG
jgi:two-component system, OmpR family, alkaline phosphatase synthesis response regulator PhoP